MAVGNWPTKSIQQSVMGWKVELAGRRPRGSPQVQCESVMEWQYRIERLGPVTEETTEAVSSKLNKFGKEQWELVTVVSSSPKGFYGIFKREENVIDKTKPRGLRRASAD